MMTKGLNEEGHVVMDMLRWGWWTGFWALCWVILLHIVGR